MTRTTSRAVAAEKLSKQRLRLWLRILKVSRLVAGELRDKLRDDHETTLPRFDVMAALYRADKGLKMSELSSVLMVSNGNVTGIVDRLAEEGRLVRMPVEGDRRATIVRLTQKGREHFADLAERHERWVNELLSSLDAVETAQATNLLDALARSLDQPEDKP